MATEKETQSAAQQGAARLSLFSNIFLVVIKVAAGVLSGSLSLLAEGVQSTVDVAASLLILLTLRAAAAPPDPQHPYGHGKLENLASLGQMLLILGTAGALLMAARDRWEHPVLPRVDWGVAALVIAVVVNLWVSRRVAQVARETHSQALQAEATHLRSDLLACLGVLGGLFAVFLTGEARLDPLIAAVMTVVVVISALRLMQETVQPLLDESLPDAEETVIRRVLDADERVHGYHRLRTRRAGSHRLMDVHVLLSDHLSFAAAHDVAEDIEDALREALPNLDVVVHAEPFEAETRHRQEHHAEEL